jgi:hypothetical protein
MRALFKDRSIVEELAVLVFGPAFLAGLLIYAGIPVLYALGVGVLVEAGHLWNS